MKKTLKSQLLAAVAMLLVAVIALSGATYAWFTSVSNAEVTDIDLYVKAGDNLYLSAAVYSDGAANANDAGNALNLDKADWWFSTIEPGASTDTTYDKILPWQPGSLPTELRNVSNEFLTAASKFWFGKYDETTDTFSYLDNSVLDPVDPESVVDPTPFTAADPDDVKGDYAKFDLYIKSSNTGVVYLDAGSSVTTTETVVPRTKIPTTVRVAFQQGSSVPVIWEPDAFNHLGTAYDGDVDGTAFAGTKAITSLGAVSAADQLTNYFDVAGSGANASTNYVGDVNKIALFQLAADTATKFTVYIWVEGADADTKNAVAKSWFTTYLKFGQTKDVTFDEATTP